MDKNFTPGPYRAIDAAEYCEIFGYVNKKDSPILGDDICIITDEDNPWTICTVNSGQPGECGPDARLIAAAPDMFELLERITNNTGESLGTIRYEIEDLLNKITND